MATKKRPRSEDPIGADDDGVSLPAAKEPKLSQTVLAEEALESKYSHKHIIALHEAYAVASANMQQIAKNINQLSATLGEAVRRSPASWQELLLETKHINSFNI